MVYMDNSDFNCLLYIVALARLKDSHASSSTLSGGTVHEQRIHELEELLEVSIVHGYSYKFIQRRTTLAGFVHCFLGHCLTIH